MLFISAGFNFELPILKNPTGLKVFDIFAFIKASFSKTNAGVGLMIMSIGGFVAYIDKIGASHALVKLAIIPLEGLKKNPYLAASLVIPIGQLLFIAIPSAAGLGLLLMASMFPLLISLGVSRLSAVSVITATTCFGMGPASAITASAIEIAQLDTIDYFLNYQLVVTLPMSLLMMIMYYFTNKYFDKKESFSPEPNISDVPHNSTAPKAFAIIPLIPILLLIVFSKLINPFSSTTSLDTTTAMIISFFIAVLFEFARTKDFRQLISSFTIFWDGMANIFKSVVTLIVTADIFAKGLISLGFINGLVSVSENLGLGGVLICVFFTLMIFLASILMGSGNASFFAFGPLIPSISKRLGLETTYLILPMQLSASIGRTVSPVSGVLIATAAIAKVSTFSIVKRNIIPLTTITILLLIINHFIQ